ncbi:D-alanyl-D-alanine carboxypeptidase family protein [Afifella sp. IM 167]|uniref:D-alanyl-D-alanine carboxypeptidase family protein n=1 Tax=Afifella sp. IM 167 TaxID=2033586 RepID=UPI001CCE6F5F|nr:D-alanyl-D-alanine carboxypeptidase family protein [Afifella sp. IM 167]MBZ8132512.1 D-alanyl-D-alanine carboxypeptidase [Afifella sp. IM 167]
MRGIILQARSFLLRLIGTFLLLALPFQAAAQDFDTSAPFAVLMDYDSGTVLLDKNADEPMAPASMAKLMTVEYIFHEIREGRLSMDDEFVISEHAWRYGGASSGGSTMFAKLGSRVSLGDLLRGIIIQSGNDAAMAVAEGIAGSEIAFSDLLNKRAKEIGMTNSTFRDATGLPDPDMRVTARDLAILARHIIADYPELYKIFAEPEFTWNNITQRNRNPLLREGIGADGLKTGHTSESGYGLVGSAVANTQRLIVVVNGCKNPRERAAEARKLLEWGFRSFRQITAFKEGEVVAEASVFGGTKGGVELKAKGPIRILVSRSSTEPLKARAVYEGPIEAPVPEGVRVGSLKVWEGDRLIQETPLYTAESVEVGSLHRRAFDALGELLLGWL